MKARLPKEYQTPSRADMLKKLQQMQEQMAQKQEELKAREYEAKAGGGAVTAVVTGERLVKSIKIDPAVVDPDDVEMLEDMLCAAVNEALASAEQDASGEMESLSGGLTGIPGLSGLL